MGGFDTAISRYNEYNFATSLAYHCIGAPLCLIKDHAGSMRQIRKKPIFGSTSTCDTWYLCKEFKLELDWTELCFVLGGWTRVLCDRTNSALCTYCFN